MHKMSVKLSVAALAMSGALAAFSAGFDGMSLATNDWFDANFTALAVDTAIAADSTTGITLGAGSWTTVPSTGTARIVEDADNSSATVLSIEAPDDELEFTPAVFASPTGMETVTFRVKADAIETLPTPSDAQAAFTIYSSDGETVTFMGYVSDGTGAVWTNLVGVAASGLTNTWFDCTMDFCGENAGRLVRFSVNGTVLADSKGTSWFPAAKSNATAINSLVFSGVGDVKTFNGDSLTAQNVASYNGTSYTTVAAAIAAGEADGWASGSVTLLANAEWTPTAAGTYNIALGSYTLSNTGDYTISAGETAGTVTAARIYTWNGSSDTWLSAANWTVGNDAHVATTYPGEVTTDPFTVVFAKNATFATAEVVTLGDMTVVADGYAVTLPSVSVSPLYTENSNLRSDCYTRITSGTVKCGNFPAHNIIVGEDAELVIDKAISVNFSYFAMFTGTGSITVDGVHFNASRNGNYGQVLKAFGGTFKLANGALLTTSSNSSQDSITGPGKFVFAGGSVVKSSNGKSHTYANDSFEIVAGTVNVSEQSLPLSKVTIVSGTALDQAAQYVVMTANDVSGAIAANAVDAALAADGWSVMQSTNGEAKAILVLTHNATYAWTGAAGDDLWATPENWLVGDYVPVAAPGAGDAVSIATDEDIEIVVVDGQNLGTITTSGTGIVSYVGPGPYKATVTEGVVALTRVPSTFVWTNSGTSNWETLSNWEVNGRTTDVLPGSYDEVKFPASLGKTPYIKYSADQTISNAVIDATVTLQIVGTRHDRYIYAKEIAGDGKLVMTNSAIGATGRYTSSTKTTYSTNLVVNVDIEFAAASTNRLYCYYGNIKVNGNMTGSGCVEGYAYQQSYSPEFAGNNEDFCGEYWGTVHTGARRDYTKFHPSGTSSNAVWTVKGSEGNSEFFADDGQTYYFGALNGTVDNSGENGSGYVSECWAEVGALNIDCGFGGYYARMTRKDSSTYYVNHIRKVGTAKLTLSLGRGCGHVEIAGGIVDFATAASMPGEIDPRKYELRFIGDGATIAVSATTTDENEDTVFCDPSARIANSTYPITFSNGVNEVHTWATALNSTNKGGLVKKGDGTLVLGATPEYKGDTYLDGGTLKIPAAAGVRVKTHDLSKSVRKTSDTIGDVPYTVYTLGPKPGSMVLIF